MTKSELKAVLRHQFEEFKPADVDKMVEMTLAEICAGLLRNERLEVRGFGSLFLKFRRARMARNPLTGAQVFAPNRYNLQFRAGKQLRIRVDTKDPAVL